MSCFNILTEICNAKTVLKKIHFFMFLNIVSYAVFE